MKAINLKNFGGPEVLEVIDNAIKPNITDSEVLIKVKAAGINRPDIIQRMGLYPPPPGASDILGLEVSGTIVEVGTKVDRGYINKDVCALLSGGGYAEYASCDISTVMSIPKNISLIDACAIPETFFTVWTNLFDTAKILKDEVLLIHGGASGIGLTAITIAQAMGIKCIATVGSKEKEEYLSKLNLEMVINYNSQDFEENIKQKFKGVDVILDMVGGDYFQKNINLLNRNGRLINIAYLRGSKVEANLLPIMLKRLVVTGSTLRVRSNEEKYEIKKNIEKYIWPLFEQKMIKLHIDKYFEMKDVVKAHQYMENNENIGKILLKI